MGAIALYGAAAVHANRARSKQIAVFTNRIAARKALARKRSRQGERLAETQISGFPMWPWAIVPSIEVSDKSNRLRSQYGIRGTKAKCQFAIFAMINRASSLVRKVDANDQTEPAEDHQDDADDFLLAREIEHDANEQKDDGEFRHYRFIVPRLGSCGQARTAGSSVGRCKFAD
jgi:hypothetical protein